jgi:hypothetical protein
MAGTSPDTAMSRFLLAFLCLASAAFAQDPKPKPPPAPKVPAKPRIAIDDPAQVKDDKDFQLQGEYTGFNGASNKDQKPGGIQIIARGDGEFEMKWYEGGLPGEGWDGRPPVVHPIRRGEHESETTIQIQTDGKWGDFAKLTGGTKIETLVSRHEKVIRQSTTLGAKPPVGAVVLFGKAGDELKWAGGKLAKLSDGEYLSVGEKTNDLFGSFTAHVEFRLPWMPNSRGQQRGNSGVYLQDRYELQILDSFGLKGANNECGGIYTQVAPKVNMCFPPLSWQTYDIDFTAATFDAEGKKSKPARVTVKHNGVLIHDNVELKAPTGHGQPESSKLGPIQFQNHRCPVVFQNVWLLPKP